jgi:hypothetical protein
MDPHKKTTMGQIDPYNPFSILDASEHGND